MTVNYCSLGFRWERLCCRVGNARMDGRCRISREANANFCSTEERVSGSYSVPTDCRFHAPTVCSTTTGMKYLSSTAPIDSWFGYNTVSKLKNFQKCQFSISTGLRIARTAAMTTLPPSTNIEIQFQTSSRLE